MTNPRVRDGLNALQEGWGMLTPQQRGEQLNKLLDLDCSIRGIADELGIPESTLRRCKDPAKSSESESDWITMMNRTLPQKPVAPKAKGAREAISDKRAENPAQKGAEAAVGNKPNVEDCVHLSTTPQAKRDLSAEPAKAQRQPIVNSRLSGIESRPVNGRPRTSLVDLFNLSRGHSNSDRIRRLSEISKSIQARPFRDARSMTRQGKPLPPKD
jgi:hypothetical protein